MEGVKKKAGFQDIVPWLTPVTDGVVATKGSMLLATFEIEGIDIDSTTAEHTETVMYRLDRAYQAFNIIPCAIWVTVMRYRHDNLPDERFANPASQHLFDIHRRNVGRMAPYRMRAFLTIGMNSQKGSGKFFDGVGRYLNDGYGLAGSVWRGFRETFSSKYAFAYQRNQLLSAVSELEKTLDSILPTIPDIGLKRLTGDRFFGFLRALVSDSARPEDSLPLDKHSLGFMDAKLPDADLYVGRNYLRLGQKYIAALSLKEWPTQTTPNVVATLLSEPVSMTFSFAFRMLPAEQAKKTVMRIRQYAEVTQFTALDYLMAMRTGAPPERKASRTKQQEAAELRAVENAIDARDVAVGYANMTVLVEGSSEEEVERNANQLRKRLLLLMPGVVREELHLLSAFSATLPGQEDEPARWALATSANLTDATFFKLPHSGSPWNQYLSKQLNERCHALAVLPTEWGTPYYFNFHDGALGHTMVIGPARSGKSVLVNFLMSQWLKYSPCHVIIFDKDKSCKINTMLHGGSYFEIDPDKPIKLNPLKLIADRRHHSFLVDWVVSLIEMRGYRATSADIKAISDAIEELHANGSPDHYRLISLQQQLPRMIASHLDQYVQGGQYGYMFDNEDDEFGITAFSCIEMGDLLRMPLVAGPFMEYAFYRITDMLEANRSAGARPNPTLIYLEECWFLLENERFASRIRDWLKTLAKMNASVIMTTQSMDDMISGDPKIFAAIRDNIPTKILLPNPNARTEALRRVYRDFFGVPDSYIERIAFAVRNRNYLVVKPDHAKMLACEFTPDQLAYLRSDSAALSVFEEEYAKGPGWEKRYLNRVAMA